MRRNLVLSHEAARHPFRRSLPAALFRVDEAPAPQTPVAAARAEKKRENLTFFAMSFAAGFVFFYGLIF